MSRSEKQVVVTGAGTGIGAATAKRFASERACVVLNGRVPHWPLPRSPGGGLAHGHGGRHASSSASGAALPHLLASKGSIVNVSSVSGLAGDRTMSVSNAATGTATNLTRSPALALGDKGVRVPASWWVRNDEQLIETIGAVGWSRAAGQVARLDAASDVPPAYPVWHQRGVPMLNARG
ncbi:SDR family NAD(P)-dependent oxidoreductase [Methylobacterium phyllosphaerae]